MTMADLRPGDMARILGYLSGNAPYRAKLLALGLTRGTPVKVLNVAPLGDPFELGVRGYHLSLRREECKVIKVAPLSREEVLGKR